MTRTLADLDQNYVWHPFTPMREWLAQPPLVIDRAEGNELIDVDGNRYLDGVSSLWVNVHGHRHPAINAAIAAQLDRVAHTTLLGLASTPSIVLAERLVALAPPGLKRVFFSDSGSTAVEVALKIAYQWQQLGGATRRTRFIAIKGAYHGDTIGAVSLGGIDLFHQIFHPLLFQTIQVPPDSAALERALSDHGDEVCAVIIEPLVQGAAGIRVHPPGLLRTAAEACRRHGVLLIADEVATGFGRTGTLFACEQEGVTPDLMAVAKGLSGGYLPVAATLATEHVFDRFLGAPRDRLTFFHGHSFGGNPLGCAAAIASLDLFARDRTVEKLPPKIEALSRALAAEVSPLPHVAEVRQKGLMIGIELCRDRRVPYPPEEAIGARVCQAARRHGVLIRPLGPVIVLMPPLSITTAQIEHLVRATAAAITESTSGDKRPPLRPAPVSPAGLFVAGTDTGVGKTTVAAAILRLAARAHLDPVPSKPVETGCAPDPADATRLRAAARRGDLPLAEICPFPFGPPVAPALAAELAGCPLEPDVLVERVEKLRERGRYLVVESAGGLLTPYTSVFTGADLAAALAMPTVLVARNSLGTISQTALAVAELRRRGLRLAGIVLVDVDGAHAPDRADNVRLIEKQTGVRPLLLPFVPGADVDALADSLEAAAVRESRTLATWLPRAVALSER